MIYKAKEICRGCKASGCAFVEDDSEEGCPCIDCLVKVVCDAWCDNRIEAIRLKNSDVPSIVSRSYGNKNTEKTVLFHPRIKAWEDWQKGKITK